MTFARSTISFAIYALVFGTVSSMAAILIVPLMTMSFFFSGFVIVFSGLSYTSFKIASSKYNHTVLFLNRLLRRLADSIPPSVGIVEQETKRHNLRRRVPVVSHAYATLSTALQLWLNFFTSFFTRSKPKTTISSDAAAVDATGGAPPSPSDTVAASEVADPANDTFDVQIIGPGAPVVYDDDSRDLNDVQA
ncbi:CYFA0S08e02014g1_1 [Cyberlindnera fabianii]|uniref:Outer spore wall protein 5 n=1 Tax=Cyberlindnera fabianii TaxID=36022 RepID=A0A061AWC6_CYBFA|nr:CYFA0S08e02014g1_1 [Cyberlindnera fabianii]